MSDYKIIPNAIKYPSSPNDDQSINLNLSRDSKEIYDYDRNFSVSLQDVYNNERQKCEIYRPTFKVNFIYENIYSGTSTYDILRDNLYYVNPEKSLDTDIWYGFPQHYEFDFYRPETYTHINYKPKSGFTYNWKYYITYPFENDSNVELVYYDEYINVSWKSSDGIPFKLTHMNKNGINLLSFVCVTKHNLNSGQFVQFPFKYENSDIFEVYSLGDDKGTNSEYIFNIVDVGYTGDTFNNNKISTFKRVFKYGNTVSQSKYYVRKNKVLVDFNGIDVNRVGFELLPFSDESKMEHSVLTPNKVSRISKKNSNNTYTFTLKTPLNLSGLIDNQKRKLSELFLTIIHCGYYGLFNKPQYKSGIKRGWGFNITNNNNSWWLSNKSDSDIGYGKYNLNGNDFYYNNDLNIGDLVDGDFCEWNDYEQKEYVLSDLYHKIKYNSKIFDISSDNGFYYKPHNKLTIKVFSDYIERGDKKLVSDIPSWAFYSTNQNEFIWRDMYDVGFVDNNGSGVDYPFVNNSHYPFSLNIFRLFGEGSDINNNYSGGTIEKITKDECE